MIYFERLIYFSVYQSVYGFKFSPEHGERLDRNLTQITSKEWSGNCNNFACYAAVLSVSAQLITLSIQKTEK